MGTVVPHRYDQRVPASTNTSRSERLQARLSSLPDSPGVYMFRDRAGDVLYVGKAKSLRNASSRISGVRRTTRG
jgi:excinuclease UvrABC nuclease subunit